MTSNIDPTVPVFGKPTTQSVRTNFQYAHDEITALQNYQGIVGSGPFALKAGDTFTGPVLLGHTPATQANEAVAKSYVDSRIGTVQSVTAGSGLIGGTITTTGTIGVNFGTAVGTVTQGNDGRFATIPGPSNTAPPANGAAAIGSSLLYARQDHSHPSDPSRVAKSGDTMTGYLAATWLHSTSDLQVDSNVYINGGLGISYAGSSWIRFGWDGSWVQAIIDGGYQYQLASIPYVQNNFATFGWVQNNYQANGSHYIPNQNVDNGASVTFGDCVANGNHIAQGNVYARWNTLGGGQFGLRADSYQYRQVQWNGDGWRSEWQQPTGNFIFYMSSGDWFGYFGYDGLHVRGNVYAANVSDHRVKRDIERYDRGMDAIRGLRPISFYYNGLGGTHDTGQKRYGLIAQEAREHLPEFIHITDKGPGDTKTGVEVEVDKHLKDQLSFDQEFLPYVFINAIKELDKRLTKLESNNDC